MVGSSSTMDSPSRASLCLRSGVLQRRAISLQTKGPAPLPSVSPMTGQGMSLFWWLDGSACPPSLLPVSFRSESLCNDYDSEDKRGPHLPAHPYVTGSHSASRGLGLRDTLLYMQVPGTCLKPTGLEFLQVDPGRVSLSFLINPLQ